MLAKGDISHLLTPGERRSCPWYKYTVNESFLPKKSHGPKHPTDYLGLNLLCPSPVPHCPRLGLWKGWSVRSELLLLQPPFLIPRGN